MFESLSIHDWMQLSLEVRAKLVEIFQIPRSSTGHVDYQMGKSVQTSDGYTYQDLKCIGVTSMQQYLNSNEEDYAKLFEAVLENILGNKLVQNDIDKVMPPLSISTEGIPEDTNPPGHAIETESQVKERWTSTLKDMKLEAESKGLLTEFKKLLRAEVKVQK